MSRAAPLTGASRLGESVPTPVTERSREGYSLVELLVVVIIAAVLFGGTGTAFVTFQTGFVENTTVANADELVRRVRDRVITELRYAHLPSIQVSPDQHSITYRPVVGWDGTDVVPGAQELISFDDVEGMLRVNDVVVAQGVKDLRFTFTQNRVRIVLEVEKSFAATADGNVTRRLVSDVRF